jgi:pantetheine-phosphate adenylyltransferase
MPVALYPGSFDPVTKGHEDLISRGAELFEELVIAVTRNPTKAPALFSVEERMELLQKSVQALNVTNVRVETFSGATVRYAERIGARTLIRGLRVISDFEYECSMYQTNAAIVSGVDTVFMMPSLEYQFLSSRMVRELAGLGEGVSQYVAPHVAEALEKRMMREM